MKTDVAILGGGCGALWLHYFALKSGIDTCLVHGTKGLGGFATFNGQNRLHSGAMYVIANQAAEHCARMVAECAASRALMAGTFGNVADGLTSGGRGFYLFPSDVELALASERLAQYPQLSWRTLGVRADGVTLEGLGRVFRRAHAVIETEEPSFDQVGALRALAELCGQLGGWHLPAISDPSRLTLLPTDHGWRVSCGEDSVVEARHVVFALGAYNPWLEAQLSSAQGESTKVVSQEVDRTLIVAFKPQLFGDPVTVQDPQLDDGSVANHVAFLPQADATTVTTGMRLATRTAQNPNDFTPWTRTLTGLVTLLQAQIRPGFFDDPVLEIRVCQKTNNVRKTFCSHPEDRFGRRHYGWSTLPDFPDIFFYSPGKWTLAARGAEQFITAWKAGAAGARGDSPTRPREMLQEVSPLATANEWPTYKFDTQRQPIKL